MTYLQCFIVKPSQLGGVCNYTMKRSLLLLTIGALLACPTLTKAQDAPPAGGPPPEGPDDQKAELKKAHDAALAANPDLAKEDAAMQAAHDSGTPPTDDQKAQFKDFRKKMDAAMVAADPNVAPILAELKKHHHHGDGPPPAPPATTGTAGASGA
jgi:hypothetical protein